MNAFPVFQDQTMDRRCLPPCFKTHATSSHGLVWTTLRHLENTDFCYVSPMNNILVTNVISTSQRPCNTSAYDFFLSTTTRTSKIRTACRL
jgi:hypothetical protein